MNIYRVFCRNGLHDAPESERFSIYDPDTDRTLVYTDADRVKGYKAFSDDETMSEKEQRWLAECRLTVEREIFIDNQQSFKDYLDEIFEKFEQNLKKAAEESKK